MQSLTCLWVLHIYWKTANFIVCCHVRAYWREIHEMGPAVVKRMDYLLTWYPLFKNFGYPKDNFMFASVMMVLSSITICSNKTALAIVVVEWEWLWIAVQRKLWDPFCLHRPHMDKSVFRETRIPNRCIGFTRTTTQVQSSWNYF